jgi:hypothetical protein
MPRKHAPNPATAVRTRRWRARSWKEARKAAWAREMAALCVPECVNLREKFPGPGGGAGGDGKRWTRRKLSEDDQSRNLQKRCCIRIVDVNDPHIAWLAYRGLSNSGDIQTANPGNILWFLEGGARPRGGQLRYQATAARKRSKNGRKRDYCRGSSRASTDF